MDGGKKEMKKKAKNSGEIGRNAPLNLRQLTETLEYSGYFQFLYNYPKDPIFKTHNLGDETNYTSPLGAWGGKIIQLISRN